MWVRTVVNLSSYAKLAVRLANTADQADGEPDPLSSAAGCAETFGDCITATFTPHDLAVLRHLRSELTAIFTAAATGNDQVAVSRMNALLMQFPIQPELVSHDDERWHVHLAAQGSASDRFASGAMIGLALIVSIYGVSRLGVCAIASCPRVFIDASPSKSRRYCAEHTARRTVSPLRIQPAVVPPSRATPAAS
jgi:predicted RNA-binding Zn ribbon-like protein